MGRWTKHTASELGNVFDIGGFGDMTYQTGHYMLKVTSGTPM